MCEDLGRAAREAEASVRRQRRMVRSQMLKHMVAGARVTRGVDWKWKEQDGTPPGLSNDKFYVGKLTHRIFLKL